MEIRRYKLDDCSEIYKLYYNTVRTVNLKDYTKEQVEAWAPAGDNPDDWGKVFLDSYAVVAELDNKIVGFGNIDNTGYLDMLYVHADYQGMGIASSILLELEKYALDNSIKTITTYASITLKPMLEKRGFKIEKKQTVEKNGQILTNFHMIKVLQQHNTIK